MQNKKFGPLRRTPFSGVVFLAVCSFFLQTRPALADLTISVSEVQRMGWGTISIPVSGSEYLNLSPANSTTSGTGNVLFGLSSRGEYRLRSSEEGSGTFTIDIGNVSTGSSYLTLDNFRGIYSSTSIDSFPSASFQLPSTSGEILYLGARETVSAGMTPTNLTPTFDIIIIIQ